MLLLGWSNYSLVTHRQSCMYRGGIYLHVFYPTTANEIFSRLVKGEYQYVHVLLLEKSSNVIMEYC